ncbi:hypothetical protein MKW92_006094 [Papaver armeniacum]|nr:hypothetical protein MKW92_006094 [Papaver armeniacum]
MGHVGPIAHYLISPGSKITKANNDDIARYVKKSAITSKLWQMLICSSVFSHTDQQQQQQQQHQHHRKSDPLPPPLIFLRSVSPYICRRSDDSSWHQNQNQLDSRFYSTPQLGPSSNTFGEEEKIYKFSILSNLFRSSTNRSVVADEQPPPEQQQQIPIPIPIPYPHTRLVENSTIYRASVSTPSPISSTWYSSLIPNLRKTTKESPSRCDSNPSVLLNLKFEISHNPMNLSLFMSFR